MMESMNFFIEPMSKMPSTLEPNWFSQNIYNIKPIYENYGWFKAILTKRKNKREFKTVILPRIEYIRSHPLSFENMVAFADFLKQMELVYFWNNSFNTRDNKEIDYSTNAIICDNKMDASKRVLRILIGDKNALLTFNMYYDNGDKVVDVMVKNDFGSKMTTNYHIVNAEKIENGDTVPNYNLLNMVNTILQHTIADTFIEIYNYVLKMTDLR